MTPTVPQCPAQTNTDSLLKKLNGSEEPGCTPTVPGTPGSPGPEQLFLIHREGLHRGGLTVTEQAEADGLMIVSSRGHTAARGCMCPRARAEAGGCTPTDGAPEEREHLPEPLSVFTGGAAAASALINLLTSGRMNEAQTGALPLQLRHAHAPRGSAHTALRETAPPHVRHAHVPKRPLLTFMKDKDGHK